MKRILKWIGIVLGLLVVIVIVVGIALYRMTSLKLDKIYEVTPEPVAVTSDATSLERGEHLVGIICTACHGEDLAGVELINDPSIGVISTANLTPGKGGAGSKFTDEDWVRAIRHGVDEEGHGLIVMPSQGFYYMSDEDLAGVIAYLKTVPPVDIEWPRPALSPMAKVMAGIGAFGNYIPAETIPHDAPRPESPPEGVTAAYGNYMVELTDCRSCHGPNLHGGDSVEPGAPAVPNVSSSGSVGNWSEADFAKAIQSGVTPSGKVLDDSMPWKTYGAMTEVELSAIYAYLKSMP